jgi:hypothetical protein
MSRFIKVKNVSFLLIMSLSNQTSENKIVNENGIHKMLKSKDDTKLPFISSSVARPIPQPGQGIPVINLNIQSDVC